MNIYWWEGTRVGVRETTEEAEAEAAEKGEKHMETGV